MTTLPQEGLANALLDRRVTSEPVYPTFGVIGAMKSGTTSFHHFLNKHPQIFMSSRKGVSLFLDPEEPIIFPSKYRSLAEMGRCQTDAESLVALKAGYANEPHFGESSTLYTRYPAVGARAPVKMLRCNPNFKLIYLLRNPIERILSQFRYELAKPYNAPTGCFDEYLAESCDAVHTSKYFFQLGRYLDSGFVQEQVHLIIFEEMVANPGAALAGVTKFLEIEEIGPWDLPHLNASTWPKGRSDSKLSAAQWHYLYHELTPQVKAIEDLLGRHITAWDLSEKACLNPMEKAGTR